MDTLTRLEDLNEDVCLLHRSNTVGKSIYPTTHLQAMD